MFMSFFTGSKLSFKLENAKIVLNMLLQDCTTKISSHLSQTHPDFIY